MLVFCCGFGNYVWADQPQEIQLEDSDYVSARAYDPSLVQITPIFRQWVDSPEVKKSDQDTSVQRMSITWQEKQRMLLTGERSGFAAEKKLPIGAPIKLISLSEFNNLKIKETSQIYWRLNAIVYQNTIYLLE